MNIEEIKQAQRINGKYFGYPQCCIDAFVSRMEYVLTTGKSRLDWYQSRVHKHTGFIPCPNHALTMHGSYTRIKRLLWNH